MKIALAAGHHNTSGGNQIEKELVGPITDALADELRLRDADVRVITPDDGLGYHPGGLDQVAAHVVTWAAQGWRADVFLEVHTEGIRQRGCFCIYPDWPAHADTDTDVRDTIGPAIARAIAQQTGIPVRDGGVMSERQTGVGLGGARLGIFGVTRSLKSTCTRLIVECGAHAHPADLAIMQGADFPARCAAAIADGLGIARKTDEPAQVLDDRRVLGIAEQSVTFEQFWAALVDHKAPLTRDEAQGIYNLCVRLQVDAAFLLAVWLAEGGTPLGQSELQRKTRVWINIKAAPGEWRDPESYNGELWWTEESYQTGGLLSVLHLKRHGRYGRLTVRQIAAVHLDKRRDDIEAFVKSVLEDMGNISKRKPKAA